jgi:hypothetical protein
MDTWHGEVAGTVEHAPLHVVKADPGAGVALSTTFAFKEYAWEQSAPQLMPVGDDVTVPVPDPSFVTVSR